MPNIAVTSKETQQLLLSADTNTVTLSENSVVKIDTAIEDVASITREGNAAIVNLKNGEKVVIESYFDDPLDSHHIVFDNGEQLYWVEFANASGEILPTIKYHFIETISPLLYADTLAAVLPWITGAVAAGATIAAVGSDSDSTSSNTPVDSTAAEQLVIAAEEAQQAAEDLLNQAQEDGLITSEEQAQLQDAADAAAEAKDTAQDAVTALPESADKEELQDRLDNLEGISVPPVTDADGNGIDDAFEAAEALVTDAENAHQAAEDVIAGAQEDGLITPAEQQAIQDAVDAATEAEQTAQDAVTALPESTDKDGLQDRLDALTDLEVPAVNDQDGNGIDDATDSLIADAEAAVAAAELAYAEAEQAIADADTDGNGLITPAEQAVAQAAIDEAAELKAIAQNAVNALPAEVQAEKDGLQERVDALTELLAPVVTDADGDGVIDDLNGLIASAEAAVAAAEAAYAEAEQAIADADTDGNGLITPAEQAVAQAAIDEAAELKAIAQNAVNALPAEVQAEKDGLQERVDALTELLAPVVTDADGDGVIDDLNGLIASAEAAVAAAEAAYAEAEQAIADADTDGNGLITPAEQAVAQAAIDEAAELKAIAQNAVTALPAEVQAEKDGLQGRLDDLIPLTAPAVTDADGNGIDDAVDQAVADAEAAVAAAEAAYATAQQAIADADTDGNGLITPAEQAAAQAAIDEAAELKAIAQNAVNALPAEVQAEKDGLQGRLDDLIPLTAPAVTDADGNGIDDAVDQAVADAEAAVAAAEAAYAEAEQAIADADTDGNGLITPAEQAVAQAAIDEAAELKAIAQNAVNALPAEVQAEKDGLQERVDALTELLAPVVTDADGDGVIDDLNGLIASAEAAVAAAEAAYAEAEQAIADADTDGNGLITPAEQAVAQAAIDEAAELKAIAQNAVTALPAEVQAEKDGLQGRLDDLIPLTAPAVTDADGNGIDDAVDQAVADAEAAVAAAEAAYATAQQAIADADTDGNGLITPAEQAAAQAAIDEAAELKAIAQNAVTALPAEVQAEKDGLQGRLDDLIPLTAPAVTDADGNGIDDAVDQAVADAEAAVAAAEAAYATAQQAIADADTDGNGLITPAEQAAAQAAIDEAAELKAIAQNAVNALPAEVQAEKDGLQGRLDDLIPLTAPAVTDADGNGIDDAVDQAVADAEAAVAAAEAAYATAQQAIADADTDGNGLITPAEQAAAQAAIDEAAELKAIAQNAVTALPAEVQAEKDGLQGRLDDLIPLTAPAVTDADGNGIDDAVDQAVADAEAAVAAAEAAYAEAEQAIADADTDGNGLITPAEQAVAQAAIDEAAELKAIAQNAVNALPAEVQAEKDGLQERVDALTELLAPVVTDADGDGVIDDLNGLIASAEAAVAAAEAAYATAQQAIADADTDGNGLITPAEQAAAQAAIDEAAELKAIAQNAVTALPAEVQAEKDGLQGRLDDLIPLTAPAVTDADGNGIDDAVDQAVADAEAAVAAAEAAYATAQQAIADADTDGNGLITPAEQAAAQAAIDEAAELKAIAQNAVTALPAEVQAEKDGLQGRLDDLIPLTAPAVTDADGNGIDDAVDQAVADAEAAVAAAEAAYATAQQAIADADTDGNGLITPAEQAAAQAAIDEAAELKAIAQNAVTALPAEVQAEKDGLQGRLDDLIPLTAPAVTDADGNGIDDAVDQAVADAEAAVAAAEAAYAEAEQAIADADTDGNGLITPAEQAVAQAAIDEAAELKAIAQNAVTALPAEVQAEKDGLQERVDALTELLAPVVTDADGDGVIDDLNGLIASAEAAVAAAEAAYAEAEQAIADADTDGNGLITPAEQAAAQAAIDEAAELKAIAQNAVTALPAEVQAEKDGLQGRLDDLIPLTAPAVTDADGNGIDDVVDQAVADAEAAVAAAEAAYATAQQAIADADTDGNGLITPAEQAAAQAAIDEAAELKAIAQNAVTALPAEVQAEKDGLQERVDALTELLAPVVTDADGDGVIDDLNGLIASAEAAVAAAEAAYAEAEQAIADADTDGNGLITPAEQAAAQAAIDEAAELKAIAQNAVTALPAEVQAEKDGLQGRLDDLIPLTAPAVTDADGNGIDDAVDQAVADAEAAVAAAEAAYATAQQAIADADTDGNGLITPAEQAAAQAAIDEAAELKAIAQNAVTALPAEVQAEKDGLQGRLDDLIPLTAPAVTDADGNGIDDAVDQAVADAEAAVAAAEAAYATAQQAIADADTDGNGLITPAEQAAAQAAIDEAAELKAIAQNAVTALPAEVQAEKDGLQGRLDDLIPLTAPAVTDADGNGIDDAVDQAVADAEAAVAAAEAAYATAQQAIADADTDGNGLITPAEQAAAQAAIDEAAELKAIAQNAVNALPAEVQAEKDGLQERVDALTELLAPVVTDADGDGVIDDLNGLIASAEAAVAAAEAAYAEAEQAIADADTDGNGLITPAEQAVAQAAIDEAAELKAIAQNAVTALPAEVQAEKDGLQGRLDDLIPLTAPAVTDADGNGIDDAVDQAVADAEAAVAAAEAAYATAQQAIADADTDGNGLITPAEQAAAQAAIDEAAELKAIAQNAVTALPAEVQAEKDGLQGRLDDLIPLTAPAVTDADGNGIDDAVDQAVADAEAAVAAAEAAYATAQQAIADADTDGNGLITPAEQAAAQAAIDEAAELKAIAQNAVNALPAEVQAEKDGLQGRLDDLIPLTAPAVTDADGNGIDDAVDQAVADAEAAVAAAEAAYAEAEQAIADADTDGNGLITPAEQAVAQAAIDEAAELKAIAQNAVNALPAEVQAEKDGLQERVDALTELLAPVVTDADGDGVIDDLNGLIASAEAAVAAAEAAYAEAEQAIADADTDGNGLITPAEQAVAQAAIDEAAELKAIAQNAVTALPAEVQAEKDGLQGRLDDLIPLTAPAVTDADGNGIDDAVDQAVADAEAAVAAAEAAYATAQQAIADADTDGNGLITPAEQAAAQAAIDEAAELKAIAQNAVTALPAEVQAEKDGLQGRLDDLIPLTAPAVTDADGNGIDDAVDQAVADAEAAVAAAEAAYATAQQAIADADTDGNGLITPAEQAAAQAAIDEAAELKAIAQNAVTALPAEVQAEKDGLQGRLDDLIPLTAPAVTDADGNGIDDAVDQAVADAEAAVAAAEAAYATAQQAIADADTDGNGLITPAEQAAAQAAIDEAAELKAIAQNAVTALPAEVQAEKDGLQGRLDDLIPLTAPAVTDADGNGIDDAVDQAVADAEAAVAAAEAAYATAQQAIADADTDGNGLITPAEQAAAQAAIDEAAELKAIAQNAVNALPAEVQAEKDGLQGRLDDLIPLTAPAVTDADGNGIDDAVDQAVADAEAAVAAAEAAYATAQQAIADADTDGNGLITPAEQAAAQAAIDEAAELKAIAQNAVTALPAEVQAEKDGLQGRLDDLIPLTAPAVTDADGNGIDDVVDQAVADAEAAVAAAEAAYATAQQAIADADTDGNGLITPAEQAAAQAAIDEAAELKAIAQNAVTALPAEVQAEKDGLQGRLDDLIPLTAPAVTDADGNGIDDVVDQAVADAEAAVAAAEAAYATAQQAIADADTDGNGLITPAEQAAAQAAIDEAAELKAIAQNAVTALPAEVQAEKDGLQGRLDDLIPLTAPAVTPTLDAIDDEYQLDMGQEFLDARTTENFNDVSYIDLLGGTTGQILGANFSIPQDPNDVGQAHTGNITITASQQDLLSVAEAFQLIVYQNVDGVQTEVARIGNQGGVVTLGGVGILGIVNNPDGISVTLSDLPEGEYTAVVAKDSSLLSDLIYGIELDKLGGEEAILGASNEQAIYDAINAVLTPALAAPIVSLVQAILVPVNTLGLPISSVVSQLLDVLPVEVIDELIDQVVAPLVTNTLTLYENTDITIDGTEEVFPTYTLSSNVFADNGNGVDVAPAGTIISEIDGNSVSGIEIIQGDYGVLEINTVTGAFTYKVTTGEEALGKTEIFNYTIQNGTQTDTAQIIIDISGTAFDDGTLLPPDYVDQVVANDDLATVQNYYEEPGDDIGNTGGAGQLLGVELVGIPISIGSTTPFNFDVLENETSDVEIAVSGFKSTTLSLSLLTTLADLLTGNTLYADAVLQRQYLDENGVAQTENFVVESGIALDAGLSIADLSFGYTYSGLINYEDLPEGIYTLSIQPQETEGELRALIDELGSVVAVNLFGGINFTITDQTNKYLGSNEIEGNVISSTDGTDLVNSTTYVKFVSNELGDPDVAIDNGNTVVEGAYGTLYISPNGAYKYVSNGDLADIGKVDTFTYTIRDFNGSEDTAQLNIRIDGEGLITWPSDPTEVGADQAVVVTATNDVGDVATTLLYNPATTVAATSVTTGLTNITSTAAVTKSMTFDVGPNDGATSVSTSLTISDASLTASITAGTVTAVLKDALGVTQQPLTAQNVSTSLGDTTLNFNFSGLVLNSGTYTIEYSFSGLTSTGFGNAFPLTLTSSTVTMNKIDLDTYQAINSAELTETGNIFTDGTADILANKFTTLTIGTQTLTQSSGDVVITGTYGNLTISGDGEYSYQANTANYGGVETFNYTLTSLSGETSTATLTIGVGRDFTSTAFNDVITTNSNGGDTVIYNLLNSASNSGGNGTDTWTDFNATEGDSIDISALLSEQSVTSETLGNFVTLEQRGEHTVVTIDRDGSATDITYAKTDLIILENTTASNLVLDDLIKYNQI